MIRRVAFLCAITLVAGACSGDDDTSSTTDSVVSTEAVTATTSVQTTTSPTDAPELTSAPTSAPPTTAVDPITTEPPATTAPAPVTTVPADVADAVATWQAALTAAASGGDVTALASPSAAESFAAMESFLAEPLVFHTFPTQNADGTVAIEECVLVSESETGALLFVGEVSADAGQVETFDFTDAFMGCIPAEVNAAVVRDYEDFWDATTEFFAPPDVNSPRLTETATDLVVENYEQLLPRLASEGKELRGRPETRPEIVSFESPTLVLIEDCQPIDVAFGIYEVATGVRTDDIPPIRQGQTDFREVTMVFEEGRWKVGSIAGLSDAPCPFPSDRAVAIVGSP